MKKGGGTMIVGVPKEIFSRETRVALIPSMVSSLTKAGLDVRVEKGAGVQAFIADAEYEKAGAALVADKGELFGGSDVILKVRCPEQDSKLGKHEVDLLQAGSLVVSMMDPYFHLNEVRNLADRKVDSCALELVPRITRAQSMDVLSSMAAIAGYKSVLEASVALPRYFPMLMTAAGTITPSKVFVIGAGVAGLMAIATAKRLGAVVQAYDTRSVVKEQVESLGAKFVEFDLSVEQGQDSGGYAKAQSDEFYRRQREEMAKKLAEVDVVITTALIPGKAAPLLVTSEMLQQMKPGSVVVDLAAERGGNVEGTVADEKVVRDGVTLIGYTDFPARTPVQASQLFSKNITTYLLNMVQDSKLELDGEDEIVTGSLVTHKGAIVHDAIKAQVESSGKEN
jgi:H+-translocating NAD(P) transhydrogenase subunit alpha